MLWLTEVWKESFKDTTTRTTRWSLWVVSLAYDEGCQGGYTGPSGHYTDSGRRWYDLCGLVGRLGGTLRTLRSLCLS